MKYSVKVNEVDSGISNLKGLATVVMGDSFQLSNISIFMNQVKNELFVSMPGYKTAERTEDGGAVYDNVFFPTTKEFRAELYDAILDTYKDLHENYADKSLKVVINQEKKEMPEFTVRVTPYEAENSNIKGLATIHFENSIAVSNIKIMQGQEKLFVAMPSYKTNQVNEKGEAIYKEFCNPVTAKFREKLYNAILNEYEQVKEAQQSKTKDSVREKLGKNVDVVNKNSQNATTKERNQQTLDETR